MAENLLEHYLNSEFTFGFELEAIKCVSDFVEDEETNNIYNEDISRTITYEMIDAFGLSATDFGEVKHDGSVKPSDDYYEDIPFEWASPVFQLTPAIVQKVINGLTKLLHSGYYTNKTCGFHTHIAFPKLSDKDAIWITCHLAMDEKARDLFMGMNDSLSGEYFDFTDEEYASVEYLDAIKDCIDNGSLFSLKEVLTDEKYRLIRIHPQGTLEWRGPRNFLNDMPSRKLIMDFFTRLIQITRWISHILSINEIAGYNKNLFFNTIYGENYQEGEYIISFNKKRYEEKINNVIKSISKNEDITYIIKLFDKFDTAVTEKNKDDIFKVCSDILFGIQEENIDSSSVTRIFKKVLFYLVRNTDKSKELYEYMESFGVIGLMYDAIYSLSGLELEIFLDFLVKIDDISLILKIYAYKMNHGYLVDDKIETLMKKVNISNEDWRQFFSSIKILDKYAKYVENEAMVGGFLTAMLNMIIESPERHDYLIKILYDNSNKYPKFKKVIYDRLESMKETIKHPKWDWVKEWNEVIKNYEANN